MPSKKQEIPEADHAGHRERLRERFRLDGLQGFAPHEALELLLTGKKIPAAKALEWGLINEVVPDEELDGRAMELAQQLAALAPSAVARTKGLFYQVEEMPLLEGLETARAVNEALRKTQDFAAGVQEFKDGKKA